MLHLVTAFFLGSCCHDGWPGEGRPDREWFNLAPHEIDLIHYCGMGLVKSCVLLFFLFPWVAIRLVLRKRSA